MPIVAPAPQKIYEEDVQFSTSVSEAVAGKLASTLNYVLNYFDTYTFGVSGGVFSSLTTPYTFSGTLENLRADSEFYEVSFFLEETGSGGSTEFRIERQLAAGGGWTNVFSSNLVITSAAADGVTFSTNDPSYPTGVSGGSISIGTYSKNDKLRWVLVSAATGAQNLSIKITLRPT